MKLREGGAEMAKMRVATAIVKFLEKMATEYVFGFNGHGNWALLDAVVHESKIKSIAARAEDQATHMADGYFRMKRTPPLPVVCTTVGPGNMNICSALANAFYESSAMVVLAGGGPTQWYERGGIEEAYRYGPEEWFQVVRPISKKAVLIHRPDTTLEMLMRAYKVAATGRPGPVVLQIPFDIQHSEIEIKEIPEPAQWVDVFEPGPDPAGIQEAAKLILKSEKPFIAVSSGIHNSLAHEELRGFAEACGIPVGTTFLGKGSFPEDHELSVGTVGRNGTGHGIKAAQNCDVLIAIGTHFSDFDTGAWTLYNIPSQTKLIHIDIDSTEISRVYPTEVGIIADARLALQALKEALNRVGFKKSRVQPWWEQIKAWKGEWEKEVENLKHSPLSPLHYARLCNDSWEVVKEVDPQTSVLFDTGHILSFGGAFFQSTSRFVSHCGHFHRMGWTAPAILGAKLANPGHPAVAFVGDGGFMMTGTSIATAVEYDLPVVWIIMNNKSLQIEREAMIRFYGRESFCDFKIQKSGELWNPDFVKFANSMGIEGAKISKPEEIKPTLRKALISGKPFVIDAAINLNIEGYRRIWYRFPSDFHMGGLEKPPF